MQAAGSRTGGREDSEIPRWAVATIALLVCAALSAGLATVPLMDPDEGRNAEVAREMAGSDDYVLPHLNGLPYLDKPILFFAAGALSMEVLGPSELAARLPSMLFALATAALIWWFGNLLFGKGVGRLAALMFLSAPLTIAFSRIVIFDSTLTFFVTASIVFLYLAVRSEDTGISRFERFPLLPAVLGWLAIGLGVLTKGPVALALPLVVVGPIAVRAGRFARLRGLIPLLVFLIAVLPWVIAVSLRRPDFLHYAFVTETFARVATGKLHRSAPFWYFVPVLLFGAFPWSFSALITQIRSRTRSPGEVLCLLWIIVPFVLFSLSNSKRAQYVLPLVVPIALLSALAWRRGEQWRRSSAVAASFLYLAFAGILLTAALSGAGISKVSSTIRVDVPPVAVRLGIAFLLGGAATWIWRRREWSALTLAAPLVLIPLLASPLLLSLGSARSTRGVVKRLPLSARSAPVISVGTFQPSAAFYLRRPVIVVTEDGEEIRSNYLPLHYEEFAAKAAPLFRSEAWLRTELEACGAGQIFMTETDEAGARMQLSRRLPLLASDERVVFYGPCPPRRGPALR